jgi:transposase
VTAPASPGPVSTASSTAPSPSPFSALSGTGTTKVWLACGVTDMRKGFDGLAVLVQQVLEQNPHSGALFAFRGKRGHLVKLLWYDGQGMCLFSKRMTQTGSVALTPAQLSMLLEGIDWRRPERTWSPSLAG